MLYGNACTDMVQIIPRDKKRQYTSIHESVCVNVVFVLHANMRDTTQLRVRLYHADGQKFMQKKPHIVLHGKLFKLWKTILQKLIHFSPKACCTTSPPRWDSRTILVVTLYLHVAHVSITKCHSGSRYRTNQIYSL